MKKTLKIQGIALTWVESQYESESDEAPFNLFVKNQNGQWVVILWPIDQSKGYLEPATSLRPKALRLALGRIKERLLCDKEHLSRAVSYLEGSLTERVTTMWDHLG